MKSKLGQHDWDRAIGKLEAVLEKPAGLVKRCVSYTIQNKLFKISSGYNRGLHIKVWNNTINIILQGFNLNFHND